MPVLKSFLVLFYLFCIIIFSVNPAKAEPQTIPADLKPWVSWVEGRDVDRNCAIVNNARVCNWSTALSLDLQAKGGTFRQTLQLDKKGYIELPGGDLTKVSAARSQGTWPIAVSIEGRSNNPTVLLRDGRPQVFLAAGTYTITGNFRWQEMPQQFMIPAAVGLLNLRLNGQPVDTPRVTRQGLLWLVSETGPVKEHDTLNVKVFRKFTDGIPIQVETRISLRISGQVREEFLGETLLNTAVATSINSTLDTILTTEGSLRVKLKPGTHTIFIHSVLPEQIAELQTIANTSGIWPKEELWVWQTKEEFRLVELEQVSAIEPSRTELPKEWYHLPVYEVRSGQKIALREVRRGKNYQQSSNLHLTRQLYLDLNGKGYSVSDNFTGTMNHGWRLNAQPELSLGRATANGIDQMITIDPNTNMQGIEIRAQQVNVQAESRVASQSRNLSASGWQNDIDSLSINLSLPPGWTLLEARGPDYVSNSWFAKWTLLDFFFVLLIAGATTKVLGLLWGIVAFVGLVICHAQPGAPVLVWFNLLAALALLRIVKDTSIKRFIVGYFYIAFGFTLLLLIPFTISQIKVAIYPELGPATVSGMGFEWIFIALFNEVLGAFVALIAGIYALICLFKKQFSRMFFVIFATGFYLILCMMSGAVFQDFRGGYDYHGKSYIGATAQRSVAPVPQMSQEFSMSADMMMESPATAPAPISKLLQRDPNEKIQTGEGMPTWNWQSWQLRWNGAVSSNEQLNLFLLSPGVNFLLGLLRVALLGVLLFAFMNTQQARKLVRGVFSILLPLLVFIPHQAEAESFPSQELLVELEQRLNRDRCVSNCVEAPWLELNINDTNVNGKIVINALADSAWPLPGPLDTFQLGLVTLNGVSATALRADEQGFLWIRVPKGNHEIQFRGKLSSQNLVALQFSQRPKFVEVTAQGWEVEGLSPTGVVADSIQLIRVASSLEPSDSNLVAEEEVHLPNYFLIKRRLELAFPWTIATTVTRVGDINLPTMVTVPLLTGERITSINAEVTDNQARITIPRNERQVSYQSILSETEQLALNGVSVDKRSSLSWKLACSAAWNCVSKGLAAETDIVSGEHVYYWRLWPEEQVQVEISRPEGVPGKTLTIDDVQASWTAGNRILSGKLSVSARNSIQHQLNFELSEAPQIESFTINGQTRVPKVEESLISFALDPGVHRIDISWKDSSWNAGVWQKYPQLSLGTEATNINIQASVPEKRWIVFTTGPDWGPAVLFWPKLLVVILLAFLIGRSNLTDLKTYEWLLLGLGLATLQGILMAIPVIWLGLMKYRASQYPKRRWYFNFTQIALAILSVVTLVILYSAVHKGLILMPDMQIEGNGSNNTMLRWYTDRTGTELPVVGMFTLPIWTWRVIMLAWSCWLALSLLRWLPKQWQNFSSAAVWWGKDTKAIPTTDQ